MMSTAIPATASEHMKQADEYRKHAEHWLAEGKWDRVSAFAALAQLHMLCVIKFDR